MMVARELTKKFEESPRRNRRQPARRAWRLALEGEIKQFDPIRPEGLRGARPAGRTRRFRCRRAGSRRIDMT
ncbi:MAG: hypothetical protein U1F77_05100 [Kiritimatiellia bacterium]